MWMPLLMGKHGHPHAILLILRNPQILSKNLPRAMAEDGCQHSKPAIQQPVGKCCSFPNTFPSKAVLGIPQSLVSALSLRACKHIPCLQWEVSIPPPLKWQAALDCSESHLVLIFEPTSKILFLEEAILVFAKNSLLCFYPKWGLFQVSFPTLVISLKLFALNNPIPKAH